MTKPFDRAPRPSSMSRSPHPIPALRNWLVVTTLVAGTALGVAACATGNSGTAAEHGVPAAAPKIINGPAVGAAPYASSGSAPATDLVKLAPAQDIIYTANLTLRVKNVATATTDATNDVTAAGGYVASEQQTVAVGPHGTGQVNLTLKIPVAAYHQTLAQLAGLGTRLSFNEQAQDVTQQVADVSSRVASAQAAITQLRALLSRAGNVGALLSVQDEINAEEATLEALLAQQQALAHETSYATVTMLVVGHRVKVIRKPHKAHRGLVAGLGAGWRALKAVVVWLLTALGTLLPFAVPIALLGGIFYLGRRRLLRRRTPPATP
jgi:hypothetical protein